MSRGPRWLIVLAAIVLTSASQGDEPKPARNDPAAGHKALDAVLFTTLRDVINRGVDLYNAGDPAACYRLYEGSLTTTRPLLEHHPDAQKIIARALAAAERDPLTWRRAFTLRNALDKVRDKLNPNPKKKADKGKKGYEKLPAPQVEEEQKQPDR
jgi:hypothetical protein